MRRHCVAGREKRHAQQRVKAGKSSAPFQYTGPLKPQTGQQSAHPAPGSKQQKQQPAQTPEAAARSQMPQNTKVALDPDEQPTPPRLAAAPKTPPGSAPAQPASTTVPRDGWMPPAEDTVAKFLSDVADIAPQPARERPEETSPTFFLASSISPEEAKRKREGAQPFWSEMQSAHLANQETGGITKPLSLRARFARRRVIWIPIIVGIVLLGLLAALAVPFLASRHRQGPTLRPTPTGLNTAFKGPTPTPVALQSLQALLQEQAPACSSSGQDFWDFPNFRKSCASDGLHLTNTQQIPVVGELLSINRATLDPDTIVVVQVSLTSGKPTDSIGLVTRFSAQDGYFFGIDAAGHWQISLWEQVGGQPRVFGSGISTALRSGLGANNTLEVISDGAHFTFYANQTWLYSFTDSTHASGHIGLAIKGAGDQAIFSNFVLYDTPHG